MASSRKASSEKLARIKGNYALLTSNCFGGLSYHSTATSASGM